jgi:hypothetical protein
MDVEPYPDEMFEEAARRESAFKAVDKLYRENDDALQRLAEIENEERMTEDQRIKAFPTTAELLMDVFYRNYPYLDKHNADIQCVRDILCFVFYQLSKFEDDRCIVEGEDLMRLIRDLRTLREPSIGHRRRDLDAL